jgi:hypothetical protein
MTALAARIANDASNVSARAGSARTDIATWLIAPVPDDRPAAPCTQSAGVKKIGHEDAGCLPPVHGSFSRIYDGISRSSKRDSGARAPTPRSGASVSNTGSEKQKICATRREQISRSVVLHSSARAAWDSRSCLIWPIFATVAATYSSPLFASLGASCWSLFGVWIVMCVARNRNPLQALLAVLSGAIVVATALRDGVSPPATASRMASLKPRFRLI